MQPNLQTQANQPIQSVTPITPIDPQPIIEHGESPTAIILAIAILMVMVMGSITGLVRVIAIVILRQVKS
ncbi:MAG: hypothetical protein Kow00121_21520 [Elainellaceae cyanobacterium]